MSTLKKRSTSYSLETRQDSKSSTSQRISAVGKPGHSPRMSYIHCSKKCAVRARSSCKLTIYMTSSWMKTAKFGVCLGLPGQSVFGACSVYRPHKPTRVGGWPGQGAEKRPRVVPWASPFFSILVCYPYHYGTNTARKSNHAHGSLL